MSNVQAIRNIVEWERTEQSMPRPEDLEKLVDDVPEAPRYLCASDYGKVTESLRRKGYTWNEVQAWLNGHGAEFSTQAIVAGWRTWCRRNVIDSTSSE